MKITREESLKYFELWSGAKELAQALTNKELDTIESILEDLTEGEGMSETEINDLFWFDGDQIAEWLRYDDEEALLNRNNEEEEE